MMTLRRLLVLFALWAPAAPSAAGPVPDAGPPAVVELFTSQGCSKCPPADRLIADLARRPKTIALSYAVATWDYIGWKDTLAEPAFSARQRAYATMRPNGLVFTPQAIVDGLGVEPGADHAAIQRDIASLPARGHVMDVPLALAEHDGHLHIAIGAAPGGPASEIYVLRVARAKTVAIDRGENSGRTQTYTNVVRAMNRLATYEGAPLSFDLLELKGEGEGYVVLVQEGTAARPGAIRAAAKTADL